jgi:hypothetical protein
MFPSRHRRAWCAALLAGLSAAACSSGGGSAKATPSTTAPNVHVRVTPGEVTVATAGPPAQLPDADRDAIFAAVGSYVQDATIAPLEGKPAPDLAAHFTAATAPVLQGPERDALLDADLPRATGRVAPTLQPVSLHALADPAGTIDLVGSTIDLTVQTSAAGGPISIHRSGELMFTRDGGTWKILSFKLAVTRDGAGLEPAKRTSSTTKAAA